MMNSQAVEAIKNLWANGISDVNVILKAVGITLDEYEEAVKEVRKEFSKYNKDDYWSRFVTQSQNRYMEIEELRSKCETKNKLHTALECIKAKYDLDMKFINTAQSMGIFDKINDKNTKLSIDRRLDAIKKLKGSAEEVTDE